MKIAAIWLAIAAFVLTGCTAGSSTGVGAGSETSATAESASDPYPATRNTAEDIEAARDVAASALPEGVSAGDLRHDDGAREEIPEAWWVLHVREPHKVVVFTVPASSEASPQAFVVTQADKDADWQLLDDGTAAK